MLFLSSNKITKQEVDSFNPGQRIPSLQLKAKPKEDCQLSELTYPLRLVGAKQPKNLIVIEIEVPPIANAPPSQNSGAILVAHREHWEERRLAPPTINELCQGEFH